MMTTAERFFAKVEFNGPLPERRPELGPCWLWTRPLEHHYYARFWDGGRLVYAHRWAYEFCVAPISDGLEIDHLCRVRHCVNLDHLEVVTSRVNIMRGDTPAARNFAKTECPKGHQYTPENTRLQGPHARWRSCRACNRASALRSKQKARLS